MQTQTKVSINAIVSLLKSFAGVADNLAQVPLICIGCRLQSAKETTAAQEDLAALLVDLARSKDPGFRQPDYGALFPKPPASYDSLAALVASIAELIDDLTAEQLRHIAGRLQDRTTTSVTLRAMARLMIDLSRIRAQAMLEADTIDLLPCRVGLTSV